MSSYKPPYTISNKILTLSNDIVELLTELKHIKKELNTPKLRKKNRIKSITGTLQIEGNSFSEEKVTNVINGKTVLGTMREIEEVKGGIEAYDNLENYNYKKEKDLLQAHKFLTQKILNNAGAYRHSSVGVGGAEGVTHVAPPPNMVPELMGELFEWLNSTDDNLLIASCVFHYEFEFIHPFSDGNGRTGRLWQSVILYNWREVFSAIPTESIVRDYQQQYYDALEDATTNGESTVFIEFMLEVILKTVKKQIIKSNQKSNQKSDQKIVSLIMKNSQITIRELCEKTKLSESGVKKVIKKLKDENILVRVGGLKGGYWEILK